MCGTSQHKEIERTRSPPFVLTNLDITHFQNLSTLVTYFINPMNTMNAPIIASLPLCPLHLSSFLPLSVCLRTGISQDKAQLMKLCHHEKTYGLLDRLSEGMTIL